MLRRLRQELRPMLALALPVVIAELGWMFMSVVDTIMVGRLSAEAIGAVSLGGILFYSVSVFGVGVLLGLDTLVSQSFGAGDLNDCHRSLASGLALSVCLTAPSMGLVWLLASQLPAFGVNPRILQEVDPYVDAINWSLPPLLLYVALRRYLQSMNIVRPVMIALLTANVVNVVVNWLLIFGHFHFPALGVAGAGWATTISRIYMLLYLVIYTIWHASQKKTGLMGSLRPEWNRMWELMRLGFPAAMQICGEVAVFGVTTALIGRLKPEALAAHQIALNAASVTFMVPLGVSSAAAVRVGQAIGRRDGNGAGEAGWTAVGLGAIFMCCAGLTFWLTPGWIVRIFTADDEVTRVAVALLGVAAIFQLFDGIQIVVTGALRGAGDTRTPMITHISLYWLLGLPLGYWLCFSLGWGAAGVWSGLCVALVLIGIVLLFVWQRTAFGLETAIRKPDPSKQTQ